jgi:peptide chain release factor 2
MGYRVETVEATPGDVVGYKSVELRIECGNDDNGDAQSNHHPYGWFKGEKGAHRLVRLSPFNANNKRQTTFAGVDVVPILEEEEVKDVDIPEKELEITTMRSGGKGGQNVNKVETGVRIKHLPSGIAVKCTEERSQGMNKQRALARLKGQLLAIAQEQRLKDIQSIRGDVVEASWGAQIRNYVMQPYKLVKDGRSGWESSDVDGFLDGGQGLEDCIGSLLRWRRGVEEEEREEADLKGV